MKKYKINLFVLFLLLLVSCDKEIEIITNKDNCNYTFYFAEENNGISSINIEEIINFSIEKNDPLSNCQGYKMHYETSYNGANSDNGKFIYNNNIYENQYEKFEIFPENFTGTFVTNVPGRYKIKFFISHEDISEEQSKIASIQFLYNFNLTIQDMTESVFVLDTAAYNINIGSNDDITLKITPIDGDLSSTLKVNNINRSFDSEFILQNHDGNINLELIPEEIGTTSFNVEVKINDVTNNIIIPLTSNVPIFSLENIRLSENTILSDQSTILKVDINTDYSHNINYTYEFGIDGEEVDTEILNGNPPNSPNMMISPNLLYGNLVVKLKVTNEYGHEEITEINLISNDVLPKFNSIIIDKGIPVVQNNSERSVAYYRALYLKFNDFTPGVYNIANIKVTMDFYITDINRFNPTPESRSNTVPTSLSILQNNIIDVSIPSYRRNSSTTNGNTRFYSAGVWGWYYNIDSGLLINDLDDYIPGHIPEMTITIIDVNGNEKSKNYNLGNGYTQYNSN